MSDIEVYIEHLALDSEVLGLGTDQRFARMTEAALQRLLAQQGLPGSFARGDGEEVATPELHLPARGGDEAAAQALALALYQSLGGMR